MKCLRCGYQELKIISDVSYYGFSCPKCGDRTSYPEKFMFNFLEQLKVNFVYQLTKRNFLWCKKYKYDFYIETLHIIIETHGNQHFNKSFETIGGKSLKQEQENDKLKKQLALENGIKEENYIVLDCRKSDIGWIKNSIMQSNLPKLLNFREDDIDWLKCHEYASKSSVKIICDLWNKGLNSVTKITNNSNFKESYIRRCLKRGKELGWCDYDSKQQHNKTKFKSSKTAA